MKILVPAFPRKKKKHLVRMSDPAHKESKLGSRLSKIDHYARFE